MESCLTLKLPEYISVEDFVALNLNPKVVLTDFKKSLQKKPPETPPSVPVSVQENQFLTPDDTPKSSTTFRKQETTLTALTPPRSTPSPVPSTPRKPKSLKRKRGSWDPSLEYEVEKILGYHRAENTKMWYLVKWKNWSHEHNTFEPIENLTGCNLELMKYFAKQEPSKEVVKKMNSEVMEGLRKRDIFKRMTTEGCYRHDLEEFSRECLDLSGLFESKDLDKLERKMKTEYSYIVRCLIGMCQHRDPGLFLRAQNYKLYLKLLKIRQVQVKRNAEIEKRINSLEETFVGIENNVDLEAFPDVTYLRDMKAGEGVVVPSDPLLGCECRDGCSPRSRCCGKMADSRFAYGAHGKLRTWERIAIYECNSRCRCPPTCPNRVVQRGRQVKLCIFKTKSRGWGVKALERIPKGTFVCQYLGELIPDSVAVMRDMRYSQEKNTGYLFDLDFFADAQLEMYCIDATREGNLARFINHSCDPNLVVYPVWIDHLVPNLHLLAFFAKRNILKNEEICFDYENLEERPADLQQDDRSRSVRVLKRLRCKCNAAKCRQWVFGNN